MNERGFLRQTGTWDYVSAFAYAAFAAITLEEFMSDLDALVVLAAALHLQAACLVLVREAARVVSFRPTSLAVVACGLGYPFLYEPGQATGLAVNAGHVLVVLGAVSAFIATARLFRSFGILPALRVVEVRGPYAFVRHPIYASYVLIDLGIIIAAPTLRNALVACSGLALILARIHLEERVLSADPGYVSYCRTVPYRLVRGVY
jgi:protein-S-isoprenylcysteine O-methyltransferase Ste14